MRTKLWPLIIVGGGIFFCAMAASVTAKSAIDPVVRIVDRDSLDHEKGESADDEQEEIKREVEGGNAASLKKLIEKLNTDYPGQILDVFLKHDHGKLLFEIKYIDPEGVVKTLVLDARSLERL